MGRGAQDKGAIEEPWWKVILVLVRVIITNKFYFCEDVLGKGRHGMFSFSRLDGKWGPGRPDVLVAVKGHDHSY